MAKQQTTYFAEPPDRNVTVNRLKKTCELMQGFCLVGLILCILACLAVCASFSSRAIAPQSPERAALPLLERLYLDDDPGASIAVSVVGGTPFTWSASLAHDSTSGTDPGSAITNKAPLAVFIMDFATLSLMGAAFFIGTRFFKRISLTGKPFCQERTREIALVAWLIALLSFVPNVLTSAVLVLGISLLPQLDYHIACPLLNYGLLASACLLRALSKVFEYGHILQTEDDGLV